MLGYTPYPVHAGMHPRRPLQRTVRILLECILVLILISFYFDHQADRGFSYEEILVLCVTVRWFLQVIRQWSVGDNSLFVVIWVQAQYNDCNIDSSIVHPLLISI